MLQGFTVELLSPGKAFTGPEPELCSLYHLAGGGAIFSDCCNAARKAKRQLAEQLLS